MIASRIRLDQKAHTATEPAIDVEKTRICARIGCGAMFCQVRQGRGRPRRYCSATCAGVSKLTQTQAARRVWTDGSGPTCVDCGSRVEPPGPRGGRPRRRCDECRRRRLRAYETIKKKRRHGPARTKEQSPFAGAEKMLSKEAEKLIPKIKDDPRMRRAIEKAEALDAELAAVSKAIITAETRHEGVTKTESEVDARRLLDGKPLESPPPLSDLQELHRRQAAIEKAIAIHRAETAELERTVICEGCEKIAPAIRKILTATVDALMALKDALEVQQCLFELLAARGYRPETRPPAWRMLLQETELIKGGNGCAAIQSLITMRREHLGLVEKVKT